MQGDRPAEGVVIVAVPARASPRKSPLARIASSATSRRGLEEPIPVPHHTICFWLRLGPALR